jgi:hypothetical protein
MKTLWHYTCEHGRAALGESGDLLSIHDQYPRKLCPEWGHLNWATDLDWPLRNALGLTMHSLDCDRARYRYRVDEATSMVPWGRLRSAMPRAAEQLETVPGAMPGHWYVAPWPVPVTYDPLDLDSYAGAFGPLP